MLFKNILPLLALIATAVAQDKLFERSAAPEIVSELNERAIGDHCSHPDLGSGLCERESGCVYAGFTFNEGCPRDPAAVKCCVRKKCNTSIGVGYCRNTNSGCSGGVWVKDKCPGGSNIRCCVT